MMVGGGMTMIQHRLLMGEVTTIGREKRRIFVSNMRMV